MKYGKKNKDRITLRAYAKINLSLDVLGRREDGYHEVEMVMQAVELYDKVTVEWEAIPGEIDQKITASSNLRYLPVNQDNIACKAARLMVNRYKAEEGLNIRIKLEKHIPVAAGLAGGSADAAAVLRGLNLLWGLNLSLADLCGLGAVLGADVPFCLWAQEGMTCALARGVGTELSPLPPVSCLALLSKPPISVSTAKVYGALCLDSVKERPDTKNLVESLERPRLYGVTESMANVLETVTLAEFPKVAETKKRMEEAGGALAVVMSGSGPTVVGIYDDENAAKKAYSAMKKLNRETFLRRTFLG